VTNGTGQLSNDKVTVRPPATRERGSLRAPISRGVAISVKEKVADMSGLR